MLTDEQLQKLYEKEFSQCTSFEDISQKLTTMKSEHINDLRKSFVNELLYSISIGYTRYDKSDEERSKQISLFCDNDFCHILLFGFRIVVIIPVQEHDDIGILLDSTRLTDVRQHWPVIRPALHCTVKL